MDVSVGCLLDSLISKCSNRFQKSQKRIQYLLFESHSHSECPGNELECMNDENSKLNSVIFF